MEDKLVKAIYCVHYALKFVMLKKHINDILNFFMKEGHPSIISSIDMCNMYKIK